jgi:glyoxylase-like metal-dependent hydrolase (beta-lactamase superfamily II)
MKSPAIIKFSRARFTGPHIFACFATIAFFALGLNIARSQQSSDGEVHALPVQGGVYMLVGAGGNITVQTGQQGVLLVDTGRADASAKVLAAIKQITNKPIRYILNTRYADDHTGGNDNLRRAGITITGANVAGNLTDASQGAAIFAHDNVLARMSAPSGQQAPTPPGAWPTQTYFSNEKEMYFNEEAVEMIHATGNSDGDSIVFFRRSDVVSAGDLFNTTGYPEIDLAKGGSLQGVIEGLNVILHLAVPAHEEEGGTLIIPGHGRLCDEADVVEYRDMVVIVRDRIRAMLKKGMTLEQVKAARPTYEYDPRYGAKTGPWTTDMFVESAYKSVAARNDGKTDAKK